MVRGDASYRPMPFRKFRTDALKRLRRLYGLIDSHRGLWLYLYAASILSIWDIPSAPVFHIPAPLQIAYTLLTGAFKASLIMVPAAILLQRRIMRPAVWLLTGVYGLVALAGFAAYQFYGFGLTRKLILIVAQTTRTEIAGFAPQLIANMGAALSSPGFWIAAGLYVLALVGLRRCPRRIFLGGVLWLSLAGAACLGWFCCAHTSGRTAHLVSLRLWKYGMEVYQWNRRFAVMNSDRKPLPDAESLSSKHLARTVIVVVGESASRRHLGCYGYPAATTPQLSMRADSLFLYTEAIGSSTSTSGNMERILSFKTDDSTCGDGLDYPLLVSAFEGADYKTFWLSNQERTGSVSNTSGVMVMDASVIKYAGAENSEDALSVKYDEILMHPLRTALADTADFKLIFLHLMGSHTRYGDRYPPRFARFNADSVRSAGGRSELTRSQARTVAEYDNSILYTDCLLGQITDIAANRTEPALVVYFSDHGENVYDEGGYAGRSARFVEVPFIVYANSSYRNSNPQIVE